MGNRKRIGLIYKYDENWIGGTYYIENIIHALNTLPSEEKPELTIFSESFKTFTNLQEKVNYSGLKFISIKNLTPNNRLKRGINYITRKIIGRNIFLNYYPNDKLDFLFPNPSHTLFNKISKDKKVAWIPDFQEIHLPQFFNTTELNERKKRNSYISENRSKIVFSSNQALEDFKKLYPNNTSQKILLPFAVSKIEKEYSGLEITSTLERYDLTSVFFIVPNQLWVHKNHILLLNTVKLLQQYNYQFKILCTGKEYDNRYPNHPSELKEKCKDLGISDTVKFLGFIPKKDLDILIKEAVCVIQPSLFEGWNTGIEESKNDLKFILASDIPVHQEQLISYPNKFFFDNEKPESLAEKIIEILNNGVTITDYNYKNDIKRFASSFIKI